MQNEFGKWRNRLWPIHFFELKKVIPLFLMKFLISLNYGILTSLKDTIIITQEKSGAEVIPVLKGWIVLPIAILATLIYSKLSNVFKRSTMFYGIILTFILFFIIYGFFLYPNKEILSPHNSADLISQTLNNRFDHWIAIYRYWMHALFFVASELWGSIVIFLLFWGFSNQIVKFKDAKRFYTIFSAGGNIAAIATGPIIWYYVNKYIHKNFSVTLQHLILCIVFVAVLTIILHFFVHRFILKKEPKNTFIDKKTKLSLKEGFKYVLSSKYLRALALMVICYGLTMNLIEVTWKANLKLQYPNATDYQSFMGSLTTCIGVISFLLAMFAGSNIIRYLGWKKSALIPPFFIGSFGCIFLFFIMNKHSQNFLSSSLNLSPLWIIAMLGAFQNISAKALKYSVFDPTKEMAFIPLGQESKVKGKAAIDVVGSRLGKSGSAWIQVLLLDIFGTGSILSITPILLPLIAFSTFIWIRAIKKVDQKISKQEEFSLEEISSS